MSKGCTTGLQPALNTQVCSYTPHSTHRCVPGGGAQRLPCQKSGQDGRLAAHFGVCIQPCVPSACSNAIKHDQLQPRPCRCSTAHAVHQQTGKSGMPWARAAGGARRTSATTEIQHALQMVQRSARCIHEGVHHASAYLQRGRCARKARFQCIQESVRSA